MDVRLEEFGTSQFDVKAWLNRQFASQTDDIHGAGSDTLGTKNSPGSDTLDTKNSPGSDTPGTKHSPGSDTLGTKNSADPQANDAQRLVTQLHFLATNAQQNSDRIKVRFRHQAAQIARDMAGLAKAVQQTQAQLAGLAQAAEQQAAAAPTIAAVVKLGTARRQLARTVAALGLQRSYTDLPQKVEALVDARDFGSAWALVDSVAGAAGLDAAEVLSCRQRIEAGAGAELARAAAQRDAGAAAQVAQLLAAHGLAAHIEAETVRVRGQAGLGALEQPHDGIYELLRVAAALFAEERAFVEAADMPDAVLDRLLERFADAMQPEIRRRVHEAEQRGVAAVRAVYDALAGFSAEAGLLDDTSLSVGAALSDSASHSRHYAALRVLFEPLRACVGGLGAMAAAHIRSGSLGALRTVEFEPRRTEAYVRAAARELTRVFSDVDEALDHVLAIAPPGKHAHAAAEKVLAVASDAACVVDAGIAALAESAGFAVADLAAAADLDAPVTDLAGAAFQPLASEAKLDAVSRAVALALLAEVLENHMAAAVAAARRRAVEEAAQPRALIAAALSDQDEASEPLDRGITGPEISTAAQAARTVVFLLGGAFRVPLARVADSSAWHAEAARSSMGVAVPQFSCAPSEDAVDIGEKMHILLPELEQAAAMHAQSTPSSIACVPLYDFVLPHVGAALDDTPLLAMLALLLQAVQRAFVRQLCKVDIPLSALGCRQLAADAEYIASVAASFGAAPDPDFTVLLSELSAPSQLPEPSDSSKPSELPGLSKLQHTLRMLLENNTSNGEE